MDESGPIARIATTVFVAMPFRGSYRRDAAALTAFFEHNIKAPIETSSRLKRRHVVRRSDDTLSITSQIIKDIYTCDVFICDLSGEQSNPNVMYELGLRMGLSEQPVILIREQEKRNKAIFDVAGLYTHPYNPLKYNELQAYLIDKLVRIEDGTDRSDSPIISVLGSEAPLIQRMSRIRAARMLVQASRDMYWAYSGFIGILAGFLRAEAGIEMPMAPEHEASDAHPLSSSDVGSVFRWILDNSNSLNAAPWARLDFEPNGSPSLDYAIATAYITDVLPMEVATPLLSAMTKFRYAFFNNWYLRSLSPARSAIYVSAVSQLHFILDRASLLLVCHEKDQLGVAKELAEMLQHFLSMPLFNRDLLSKGAQHGQQQSAGATP